MSRLVEFPLQDGGAILVQVDEAAPGPVTRGLGDRRLVTEQAPADLRAGDRPGATSRPGFDQPAAGLG
jgi:hypothetical protein